MRACEFAGEKLFGGFYRADAVFACDGGDVDVDAFAGRGVGEQFDAAALGAVDAVGVEAEGVVGVLFPLGAFAFVVGAGGVEAFDGGADPVGDCFALGRSWLWRFGVKVSTRMSSMTA